MLFLESFVRFYIETNIY